VRRRESNAPPRCKRGVFLKNLIPECRCGRVESNHHSRGDGLRPVVHRVDDRGIEPRMTAVSERRLPSRPVVGLCPPLDPRLRRGRSLKASPAPRAATAALSLHEAARGVPLANTIEASPGNRTLLHWVTARGLATSLATQSRREESNPRSSTVGSVALSTELRRVDALDGDRTRLTRETAGPHRQTRPRAWRAPGHRRSGRRGRRCAPLCPFAGVRRIDAVGGPLRLDDSLSRSAEAERCCPCHSPTLRPWIAERRRRYPDGRRPTWRSFGARASRRWSKLAGKSLG
jgi:hypothetical protein